MIFRARTSLRPSSITKYLRAFVIALERTSVPHPYHACQRDIIGQYASNETNPRSLSIKLSDITVFKKLDGSRNTAQVGNRDLIYDTLEPRGICKSLRVPKL